MASDDVRALADRIVASANPQWGADDQLHFVTADGDIDVVTGAAVTALARAVLAQETRPTCATCRWWYLSPAPGSTLGLCLAKEDGAQKAHGGCGCVATWYCADHEPAPPDQPREEKA